MQPVYKCTKKINKSSYFFQFNIISTTCVDPREMRKGKMWIETHEVFFQTEFSIRLFCPPCSLSSCSMPSFSLSFPRFLCIQLLANKKISRIFRKIHTFLQHYTVHKFYILLHNFPIDNVQDSLSSSAAHIFSFDQRRCLMIVIMITEVAS